MSALTDWLRDRLWPWVRDVLAAALVLLGALLVAWWWPRRRRDTPPGPAADAATAQRAAAQAESARDRAATEAAHGAVTEWEREQVGRSLDETLRDFADGRPPRPR